MAGQFSISGIQYKHFDDGVDIAVDYTRHDLNVTHINSVRYSYNLEYMDIDYDCSYTDFIHSHPKVRISKNMIDVEPRVRQMMDQVESELRSADGRDISRLMSYRDVENAREHIWEWDEQELGLTRLTPNKIGAPITDGESPIEKPAPKRKYTRWELLELD